MVLRENGASDPLGESTFSRKASEGIGSNLLQQNPPLQQRSNETAELRATPIAAAGFVAPPTCKSAGPNSWGVRGALTYRVKVIATNHIRRTKTRDMTLARMTQALTLARPQTHREESEGANEEAGEGGGCEEVQTQEET